MALGRRAPGPPEERGSSTPGPHARPEDPAGGSQEARRGVEPQERRVMQWWRQRGFHLLHLLHVLGSRGARSASCRGRPLRRLRLTPGQTLGSPARPAL